MAKTLVGKTAITGDPKLVIIKAFRIANKRAGEAKRLAGNEEQAQEVRDGATKMFEDYCESLRTLADKAEAAGFNIWVNFNGRTGHTYEKDYKPTPDIDNDLEAHKAALAAQAAVIENEIFPTETSVE